MVLPLSSTWNGDWRKVDFLNGVDVQILHRKFDFWNTKIEKQIVSIWFLGKELVERDAKKKITKCSVFPNKKGQALC